MLLNSEKERSSKIFKCENPDCGNEHDGSYGSGRFCCEKCMRHFIAKTSYHTKINHGTFVSNLSSYHKPSAPFGTWKCSVCGKIFKTRRLLKSHRKAIHDIKRGYSWNRGHTKYDDERLRKVSDLMKTKFASGEIKPSFLGKHHSLETKHKLSLSGGKRPHSGWGKQGRYLGVWCDSSWELAWVIFNHEHNIKFRRFQGFFEYEFNGKNHKYYPDFQLEDGTIVEIKGYTSEQWKYKMKSVPPELNFVVLYKKEIKPYLDYAINKYGKDFTRLYD